MRLTSRPGDKVRFLNENGLDAERVHASRVLDSATAYTVKSLNIGGFSSTVELDEVPGRFNTVMFANIDERPPQL